MTMFQNLNRSLPAHMTLKIACEACDHRAEWTRPEAFRWLGPDATPYDIRRKLFCRECGGRPQVWI